MLHDLSRDDCAKLSDALANVSNEDGATLLKALVAGLAQGMSAPKLLANLAAMDGEALYDVVGVLEQLTPSVKRASAADGEAVAQMQAHDTSAPYRSTNTQCRHGRCEKNKLKTTRICYKSC